MESDNEEGWMLLNRDNIYCAVYILVYNWLKWLDFYFSVLANLSFLLSRVPGQRSFMEK